jgi:hypothetical protein
MVAHIKGAVGRDYAAEYAARKARAAARGLTTAQARGHAPAGTSIAALRKAGVITTTGSTKVDSVLTRFYGAVNELAKGTSLTRAAKAAGIAPSTVKRYNTERKLFQPIYHYKEGKPSTVKGYRIERSGSTPLLADTGTLISDPPVDAKTASLLGQHWNAIDAALKGDDRALRKFRHTTIQLLNGNTYRLMTDVNAIYRFFDSMSEGELSDFWRTFYTGRTVIYAPAA